MESVAHRQDENDFDDFGFNSLQTGKFMESSGIFSNNETVVMFPFPSNGKVHGKDSERGKFIPDSTANVFQFPSNGKVHGKFTMHLNTD